jgi:hypothetical protein
MKKKKFKIPIWWGWGNEPLFHTMKKIGNAKSEIRRKKKKKSIIR